MAYAARCLIRLASLLPHAINLRQVGKDVEALAGVIANSMSWCACADTGRGLQISGQLQNAVLRARLNHTLPPSSRLPSPEPAILAPDGNWEMGTFENTDFSWAEGWDFGLADQLFSTVTDTVSLQGD